MTVRQDVAELFEAAGFTLEDAGEQLYSDLALQMAEILDSKMAWLSATMGLSYKRVELYNEQKESLIAGSQKDQSREGIMKQALEPGTKEQRERMSMKQVLEPRTEQETKESENCPACREKRYHTEEEWKNHPRRGTGQDARIAPQK